MGEYEMMKMAKTLVFGLFALMAGMVNAAVPIAATTALTDLQTDALAIVDLVWPVVGAVTIAFILIKIFRRGANKV
jgi:uncharacterized membrane protein YeaQ/YmgE (transglycosylase-associated protein family)